MSVIIQKLEHGHCEAAGGFVEAEDAYSCVGKMAEGAHVGEGLVEGAGEKGGAGSTVAENCQSSLLVVGSPVTIIEAFAYIAQARQPLVCFFANFVCIDCSEVSFVNRVVPPVVALQVLAFQHKFVGTFPGMPFVVVKFTFSAVANLANKIQNMNVFYTRCL